MLISSQNTILLGIFGNHNFICIAFFQSEYPLIVCSVWLPRQSCCQGFSRQVSARSSLKEEHVRRVKSNSICNTPQLNSSVMTLKNHSLRDLPGSHGVRRDVQFLEDLRRLDLVRILFTSTSIENGAEFETDFSCILGHTKCVTRESGAH